MGITLIFIALLLVGILLLIINHKSQYENDGLFYGGVIATCLGAIATFAVVLIVLIVNCEPNRTNYYQRMVDTKNAIVMRLEGSGGFIGSFADYQAVIDYNDTIRTEKTAYKNFFLSWFANPLIAQNCEYIDISDYTINYSI